MIDRSTPERVSEALLRVFSLRERNRQRRPGYQAHDFTIAISRETGAGGSSVARLVGEKLGWAVYDHELLERLAEEMKVRVSLLESVDERHIAWLEEQVEAFSRVPYVSENAYVHHLIQVVLTLGLHGQCVIVGRGASFILPSRSTLRVRLVAGLEDRISAMAAEANVSRHEAARLVRETDRERAEFIREHFHQDVADPLHYDLTLNTSRLSIPVCCDLIVTALDQMKRRMPQAHIAAEPAVAAAV